MRYHGLSCQTQPLLFCQLLACMHAAPDAVHSTNRKCCLGITTLVAAPAAAQTGLGVRLVCAVHRLLPCCVVEWV